jgi:predicted HAD superfamily phosphohydrolase YqeG
MLEMDYKSIAMIGDQVLTDVVGANRVGMFSIYVKPVSKKDYWYTAWKRPLEALILKHYGYSK